MDYSRKPGAMAMLISDMQANLFVKSHVLPFGSARFIKRFAYSWLCQAFDDLSITTVAQSDVAYLREELHANKRDNAPKWTPEELHWIGYIYRYWAYVEGKPMYQIFKQVPPKTLLSVYPLYHSLDPMAAIERLKEAHPLAPYEQLKAIWKQNERHLAKRNRAKKQKHTAGAVRSMQSVVDREGLEPATH